MILKLLPSTSNTLYITCIYIILGIHVIIIIIIVIKMRMKSVTMETSDYMCNSLLLMSFSVYQDNPTPEHELSFQQL